MRRAPAPRPARPRGGRGARPPAAPGRRAGRRPAARPTSGATVSVVASFYPIEYAVQQVGGDARRRHQPDQARRRAARPRAEPAGRRQGRRGGPGRLRQGVPAGGRHRRRPGGVGHTPSTSPPPRTSTSRRRRRHEPDGDTQSAATQDAARQGPALLARPAALRGRRDRHRPAARRRPTRPTRRPTPRTPRPSPPSSTTLDAEFRTTLASCARKDLVTSHAAFGYLSERYGFTQVPIAGPLPRRRTVRRAAGRGRRLRQGQRRHDDLRRDARGAGLRRDRRQEHRCPAGHARPDRGTHQRVRGPRLP